MIRHRMIVRGVVLAALALITPRAEPQERPAALPAKTPAPPSTWKEHWFEHDQEVQLVSSDADVAIDCDDKMPRAGTEWSGRPEFEPMTVVDMLGLDKPTLRTIAMRVGRAGAIRQIRQGAGMIHTIPREKIHGELQIAGSQIRN